MRKTLFILLCLFVSIVGVSCVSAADMNDGSVIYLSDSDKCLDVEDTISMSNSNDDSKRPLMELPKGYETKRSDESNDEIDLADDETNVTINNDTSPVEDNGTSRKDPPSSDGIIVSLNDGVFSVDVNVLPKEGSFKYLQSLVDIAKVGSTLYLRSDYYGGKNSKVTVNKNLTIDGQGHTINCNNWNKCFAFYSTKGNIVLKNLNIKKGHNNDLKKGGAIYIGGSASYTLINCNFTDNWAEDYGGAIYNDAPNDLIIKNCCFRNNSVGNENGGAIFSKGKICLEGNIFDSNKANVDGGAIFCEKDVDVIHCLFKYNKAEGAKMHQCYGGAIRSKQTVSIDNSTFEFNVAADYGGAVYAKNLYVFQPIDPILKINPISHFNKNSVKDNDGGALYVENNTVLSYAHFVHNTAYEDGGAICCKDIFLDNCYFRGNGAEGSRIAFSDGGSIFAKGEVYLLDKNVFTRNYGERYDGICAHLTYVCGSGNLFLCDG